jgi:hypothetical protein
MSFKHYKIDFTCPECNGNRLSNDPFGNYTLTGIYVDSENKTSISMPSIKYCGSCGIQVTSTFGEVVKKYGK